jgi:hypothetical protein
MEISKKRAVGALLTEETGILTNSPEWPFPSLSSPFRSFEKVTFLLRHREPYYQY